MLSLTLDIVPFGQESHRRIIGALDIARTTPHNDPEDYRVWAYRPDGECYAEFAVCQHPRAAGAWVLVQRAIECLNEPDYCAAPPAPPYRR